MQIIPCAVDLFHGDMMFAKVHRTDPVADYKALGQTGRIRGVVHEATRGELYTWQV
jgi:hypothetical protein